MVKSNNYEPVKLKKLQFNSKKILAYFIKIEDIIHQWNIKYKIYFMYNHMYICECIHEYEYFSCVFCVCMGTCACVCVCACVHVFILYFFR